MLLSVTRTDGLGFWSDPRRMTVALTRARHLLRVFVNAARWRGKEGVVSDLVADADARQALVDVVDASA